MHTIVSALANTLEGLLVFLATFFVAMLTMAAFGDVAAVEARVALLEAIVAVVLWTRLADSRLTR